MYLLFIISIFFLLYIKQLKYYNKSFIIISIIIRYLRKNINTQFEYNSSKMLGACSKKRPDVYFELNKHQTLCDCRNR